MSLSSKISTNIKSNISKLSSHKYKNILLIILIIVIIVILYLIITTFVLKNTKNEIKKEGFDALTINNNSLTQAPILSNVKQIKLVATATTGQI